MNSKLMTILVKEYLDVVKKKMFVLGILITPIFITAAMFLPALLIENTESPSKSYTVIDMDNRGLGVEVINTLADITLSDGSPQFDLNPLESYSVNSDRWFERRAELDSNVLRGELDGVILLFPNLLENDSVVVISKSFDMKMLRRAERRISSVLSRARLSSADLGISIDSLQSLTKRIDMDVVSPSGKSKNFGSMFFGMMIFAMLTLFLVMNFGQSLMRSVIDEKTSRIMEVMISSVTPFELMLGKILGMGAAALTQVLAWVVLASLTRLALQDTPIPSELADSVNILSNPIFILYFIAFLVGGFFLYSTIFAAIGSIVNSDKEAQNFLGPVMMVFMIPFMLAATLPSAGDKTWVTVLSMIPLLSPNLMVMRLSIADPSSFVAADPIIIQASISLLILYISVFFSTWVISRIFRVGILMYGKRATFPEIIRWVGRR